MHPFLESLKRQAMENPIAAAGVGAAILATLGKFIEQVSHARGSHAYARDVNRRVKKDKQ